MANLVIVESPAKARTISKFLGRNYKVEASQGHVRDLPKSQLGVDVEHDFDRRTDEGMAAAGQFALFEHFFGRLELNFYAYNP